MSIITNPGLQTLWQEAQNKPEWATTRLWQYIFKEQVFRGENWCIASQQPPIDEVDDLLRVDIVPKYLDNDENSKRIFFFRAQSANPSVSELEGLEKRAVIACSAYLAYFGKAIVWAVTAFGGKARLWTYRAGGDHLIPYIPEGNEIGDVNGYIEIHNSQGYRILDGLKFMRDHPEPASDMVSDSIPRLPAQLI